MCSETIHSVHPLCPPVTLLLSREQGGSRVKQEVSEVYSFIIAVHLLLLLFLFPV